MIDLENLHYFVRFYNTEALGSGTLRFGRTAEEGGYSEARFWCS